MKSDSAGFSLRRSLLLYAVTDRAWIGAGFPCDSLSAAVLHAVDGGATMIQLREKNLADDAFLAEAHAIKLVCAQKGVPLLINDNVAVAQRCGADGVHIGQDDGSVVAARKVLGSTAIIGVSCQTVAQALLAEKDGADYLGVGAVFPTGSKADAAHVTLETLQEICHAVKIPVVAIGGITAENAGLLKGSGIAGISVISAIFAARDIRAASRVMLSAAQFVVGKEEIG